ncbi:MAG TPA: hypothetical protein DCQ51_12365 [Planktothrix sp. UBA8407]|nr:hypothetical protein [Planktothrix sp. UBA8407]
MGTYSSETVLGVKKLPISCNFLVSETKAKIYLASSWVKGKSNKIPNSLAEGSNSWGIDYKLGGR